MSRDSGSILRPPRAAAVSGDHVGVGHSAVPSIEAERVEMRAAAARDVRSETVDLTDSVAAVIRAQDVHMRDCATIAVIGDQVQVRESQAIFLLGRRIEGDVHAVFTPASAFALGLGLVLGVWIIRRLRALRIGS